MDDALQLARWIQVRCGEPVTHLKLQKLVFYSYGAALAFGLADEIGEVAFEAWRHGPVCRGLWVTFNCHGRSEIPLPDDDQCTASYSPALEHVLDDVLAIYGQLDAWSLRQQTHLEQPWIEADARDEKAISRAEIFEHFKVKFCSETVEPPEYFLQCATFTFDGVPAARFGSFHELAQTARAVAQA